MAIPGYTFGTWTQIATFSRANAALPSRPNKLVVDGLRIAMIIEKSAGNQDVAVSLDAGVTWNFYDTGIAFGTSAAGLTFSLGSLWIGELNAPSLRRSDNFGQTWVADSVLPNWAATSKWPIKVTVSGVERIYAFAGPGVASNTIRRRNSADSFTAIGTSSTTHYIMSNGLPLEPNKVLLFDSSGGGLLIKIALETLVIDWTRVGFNPTAAGNVGPLFGATGLLRYFFCKNSGVIDRTVNNGSTWVATTPLYLPDIPSATGFFRFGDYDFALQWNATNSFALVSIRDSSTTWALQAQGTDTAGFITVAAHIGNVTASTADLFIITQSGTTFHVWKTTVAWTFSTPDDRLNYPGASPFGTATGGGAMLKYYDNMKAALVSFPTGDELTNNQSLWYFVGKGFIEDSRAWSQVLPFGVSDQDTKIFAWDAAIGIIREIDVSRVYTDDGSAIVPRIDTGFIGGTERDLMVRWAWLGFITGQTVSAAVAVTVDDDSATDSLTMNTNIEQRLKILGHRIRLVIDFTSSSFFRLSEVVLRYLPFRSFRPRS